MLQPDYLWHNAAMAFIPRYFSPDELRRLAERIQARVDQRKVTSLTPDSAFYAASGLRMLATRPVRPDIMPIICGHNCDKTAQANCMSCIGKANLIERMYEGRADIIKEAEKG